MSVTEMTHLLHGGTRADPWHQATLEQAEQLVSAALCMNIRHDIEAAAPVNWEAGTRLLESDQPEVRRFGIVFLLHALATTPGAAQAVAEHILAQLQADG